MKRLGKRAISPVIATVIIVAVAIAVAIAVAFWMTGIVGLFTGFEQVQVAYIYAEWDQTNGQWTISLRATNTGTATATVDEIFVNGIPLGDIAGGGATATATITVDGSNYNQNNLVSGGGTGFPLPAGSTAEIEITITPAMGFAHGQSVEVKIHTVAGKEYPKLVVLP